MHGHQGMGGIYLIISCEANFYRINLKIKNFVCLRYNKIGHTYIYTIYIASQYNNY